MKTTILAFAAAFVLSAGFVACDKSPEKGKGSTVGKKYVCEMYCVLSEKPGKCPKCGMEMKEIAADTTFTCPMHPEVASKEPGKCPKCKMKLKPAEKKKDHEHNDGHRHD